MLSCTVHGENGYNVTIGSGITRDAIQAFAAPGVKVMLVTDDNIAPLWLDSTAEAVRACGAGVFTHIIPHGEASKSLKTLEEIWTDLSRCGFCRNDICIALGGGVTGDICGFAAAAYMRGIRLIQLPTSLLAMVDSSVGGKSAVNLGDAKNSIGVFRRPAAVICDTDFLSTLPREEYSCGMAEIIKYGFACRPSVLEALEKGSASAGELIYESVMSKKELVEKDEFDTGARLALNFGHTVAHAIEALSEYTIPHGMAVAAGMNIILRAEAAASMCSGELASKAERLCTGCSLPVNTGYPARLLCGEMLHDKKRIADGIRFVLVSEPGKVFTKNMDIGEAESFIEGGLS